MKADLPEAYTSAVSNRFTPFSYAMAIRFSAIWGNTKIETEKRKQWINSNYPEVVPEGHYVERIIQ